MFDDFNVVEKEDDERMNSLLKKARDNATNEAGMPPVNLMLELKAKLKER